MENVFENALNENSMTDDFVRNLIHESLDGIFK